MLQRDGMNWVGITGFSCGPKQFSSNTNTKELALPAKCVWELSTDSVFMKWRHGWAGSLAMIMYKHTPLTSVSMTTIFYLSPV